MKKLTVAALVLFVFLTACNREKDEATNRDFLGTWKLDKVVDEEYHPVNTLISRDEEQGMPGDSVVFKSNGIVLSYQDGFPEPDETDWKLINDTTINIEYERYKIRKISDTEFYLHQEEIDRSADEKWVYQVYLKR